MVEKALTDRLYYWKKYLKIKVKKKGLVPFVPNKSQIKVLQILDKLERGKAPIRIVILKARQLGISTLVGALLFFETIVNSYTTSAIAAHKEKSSTTLFSMYRRFYNHLPPHMRPETKYSNRKELLFETAAGKGLQSNLYVFTAGGKDSVRSDVVHNFHWSEVAFSRHKGIEEVEDSVFPAMPNYPVKTMTFYESTANGDSGLFYDTFMGAWENKNDWTPIFLPWHTFDEYQLPVPPGFRRTDEEEDVARSLEIDNKKLFWRRYKIQNDFKGNLRRFWKEYPSSVEEAFHSTIASLFDYDSLREMKTLVLHPRYSAKMVKEALVTHRRGNIRVFYEPEPTGRYVMGVDSAGGGASGDLLVAQVLKIEEGELHQVAVMVDRIHPYQFGVLCARLGNIYNNALIIPERNFHGVSLINALQTKGYKRIYREEDKDEVGITTHARNKPEMVDDLHQYIWQRRLIIRDEGTYNALKAYREEGGKFFGKEDDYVMALVMAVQGVPRATRMKHKTQKKEPLWDAASVFEAFSEQDWDEYYQRCLDEGVI